MEVLSAGFCAAALTQTLAPGEVEEWQRQWLQPVLQVVDIQRYPRCPTIESGPCRFYVAASDGQSLVWLIAPPQTPLEEAIASFELEVGCCVTLLAHTLVTAANGLNVVVPLQVKYTANTLRLLGQPACSEQLFALSPNSLVQRGAEVEEYVSTAAALRRPSHRIAVRDVVDNPEKALGNWSIAVRVVWRGREYQVNSPSRTFGSHSASTGTAGPPRFVFRCLLVDDHGDGIVAAFFGGEGMLDRVQLHDCMVLAQGTVKWGVGEVAAPVELQFVEKSIEENIDAEDARRAFPHHAAALVGEVAKDLNTVTAVVGTAQVGDLISVVGLVAAVQNSTQITTKRGRVWRSVVTLADDDDKGLGARAGDGGHGKCYVEVTLWGEIAESVEPAVGERWVFHSCFVQVFQQRKTLSSRASTMAVQLRPFNSSLNLTGVSLPPSSQAQRGAAAPALKSTEAGHPEVSVTDASIGTVAKPMQFVLDLNGASPTLPVLARVQEVESPLLRWTCTACHRIVDGAADSCSDSPPEYCDECAAVELSPSLHLAVWLSDSLSLVEVAFHGSTAESLVEATAVEVARALQRRPEAGAQLRGRLVGVPVLMWMLPDTLDSSGARRYIATACRHIQYVTGCHPLLTALEAFTEDVDFDGAQPS